MSRMKIYSFDIPIFEGVVTCLVGGNVETVNKYLKEKHGDNFKAYSWGEETKIDSFNCYQFHIEAEMNEEVFYVWFPAAIPSDIVHETNHLCSDVFYVRGIKYCYESEEAFRYFEGWMFGQIHSILKGKLKIKK